MKELAIQNGSCLLLSLIVTINSVSNYLYGTPFDFSIPFIILYFGVDLFYCPIDLKIHHIFCFLSIYYKLTNTGSNVNNMIHVARAINITEVSTIFFSLKYFITDKRLEILNNGLFIVSFFYIRIFNYFLVMSNRDNFTYVNETNNKYALYISVYGLLTLNIYWATILLKILMKGILKSANLLHLRRIISYMYFANPIITLYIYSNSPNISYIPHIVGAINLSIQSYNWHSKSLEYSKTNSFNIVSKDLLPYFLIDNASIFASGFLTSVSGYYYSESYYSFFFISLLYHGIPFGIQCYKSYEAKKENRVVNQDSIDFLVTTYILSGIPVLIDVSLCAYHSLSSFVYFPLIALHIFQACLLKINPFYEYTHLVFHSTLYIQTILLCLSNLR